MNGSVRGILVFLGRGGYVIRFLRFVERGGFFREGGREVGRR